VKIDSLWELAYLSLGITYRRKGDTDIAINTFRRIIDLYPQRDDGYFEIGYTYFRMKNYDRAENYFKKAIELMPKFSGTYDRLRRTYLFSGKFDDCIKLCEKAIADLSDKGRWYSIYASTLRSIGEFDLALQQIKKAYDFDKNFGTYNNNLGVHYYYMRDYNQAVLYLEEAIILNPVDYNITVNLSRTYHALGMFREAADSYRELFKTRIKNIDQIYKNSFSGGNYNKTTIQDYFRKMLGSEDSQNSIIPNLTKARFFAYLGKKDEAIKLLYNAYNNHHDFVFSNIRGFYFDGIRDEPEFKELLKYMKLDEYYE